MIQIIGTDLYQWDSGRSLGVTDSSVSHVHLANKGDSKAVVMEIDGPTVKVPDYLLQTGKQLCVYAVNNGVTVGKKVFPVSKRERPEYYSYDEDERNFLYALIQDAEDATAEAERVAKELQEAKDNGDFNGFSPTVELTKRSDGVSLTITDASGKSSTDLTASDLGARPDTWTPTAQEVGARPNTWLPTIAEIGAAPAGYGLGSNATYIDNNKELKDVTLTGFYFWSDASTASDKPFSAGDLLVIKRTDSIIDQTAFGHDTVDHQIRIRKIINGEGTEWEWVNPLMLEWEEYRTTERYEGKPVYAKVVSHYIDSVGAGSVSGVTDLAIPHGISNFGALVRCDAKCSIFPLPIRDGENKCVTVYSVDSSNITLRFINDHWSSAPFKFTLYYTKA